MSDAASIVHEIHTSCKNCVFATYDNITQTDCAVHMLEKYKNKQCEIIEAYDEEKEFYIINDRKCISHRKIEWFNKFEGDTSSLDFKIDKVKESNRINYILLLDLKLFTIDKLQAIFKEILLWDIKPSRIIILRHTDNNIFGFDIIKGLIDDNQIVCPWRIQTIVSNEISLRSTLSNMIQTHRKNRFLLYVKDYDNSEANKIINMGNKIAFDDLETFEIISNKQRSIDLFSGLVYRCAWFYDGKDILTDTPNPNMIMV